MRGMDRGLLSRRIKAGVVPVEGEKELIDIEKADAALAAAMGPQRKPGSKAARPGSGRRSAEPRDRGVSLHQAKVLRAREEAKRAKIARRREALELAVLEGKYASIEDLCQTFSEILSPVRSHILALPSRCAASVPESERVAVFKSASEVVRLTLEELQKEMLEQLGVEMEGEK